MSGIIGGSAITVSLKTDTVTAALERLGPAFVGQKLELALAAGALLVANDAKRNAPIVTGTLRRSIHIGGHTELTPDFTSGEGYDDIGGNVVGPAGATLLVGTDLAYAARIEFGFMGADSLGRTFHQAAQPYLRPAWDANLGRLEETVSAVLGRLLQAALG